MAGLRRLRDPLAWAFILTAALAILGFTDMLLELGRPFGGYVSFRRAAVAVGRVEVHTPVWWSGVIQDQLARGDTLLAADGQPYYPHVREAFSQAAAAGHREVAITLERPGIEGPITRAIHVQRFHTGLFLDVRLPDIIMFLVFWLLGFIAYRSDPANPTSRAFAYAAALTGMSRALYVHNLFMDDTLAIAVEVMLRMTLPFARIAILVFAFNFPTPTRRYWRALMIPATATAIILSALAVAAWLPWVSPPLRFLFGEINYLGTVALYFFGLAALIGRLLSQLIRRQRQARRERRFLTIILLGVLVATPMLVVAGLNWIRIGDIQPSYYLNGLDVRYLTLGAPLALAYVLARYRAVRSPSWLFVFVILLCSSALVAAVGAWVWTWGMPNWPETGAGPPFTTLLTVAFVSSLAWSAAASASGIFGRFFHYDQRTIDAVRNFGRRIAGDAYSRKTLPADVARGLVDEMQLERAAVWLRGEDGGLELAARRGVFPVPPASVLVISDQTTESERNKVLTGAPLRIDREDRAPGWLRPIAGPHSFELALPLIGDEGLIGLIALGPRWDEYIFDERDLVIAELIGLQATLFFTVAAGIAELRRVPGRMADAQDHERQRLAQELHDTIQQFLGRLPFYLSFSRDALQNHPEKARQILDMIIADGEDTAASVRQIRYNLAPSQLERGLAGSLVDLCRHFEERSGIATAANIAPEVDDRTTLDMRFAVYRVIQQALDNVEAHAGASAVAVALALQDGHIAFSVRDNGRGSTEAQRRLARERGSFGLESMRARLEAGGGEFELHPGPDGTEVRGRLPAVG